MKADEILRLGIETLIQRGLDRDQPDGERSMAAVVGAFGALTDIELTEQQGWLFMALVKIKRSQSGRADHDHYVDGANYIALAGEAALTQEKPDLSHQQQLSKNPFAVMVDMARQTFPPGAE